MSKEQLMKAIRIENNTIVIKDIDLSKMNIQINTDIGGYIIAENVGKYVITGNVKGSVITGNIGCNLITQNVGGYIDTSSCYQSPDKKILLPQITADDIRRPYTSKKTYKGITIYKLYNDKKRYTVNYSHLITNGFVSAHGTTIEKAKEIFKKKIEIFKKEGK